MCVEQYYIHMICSRYYSILSICGLNLFLAGWKIWSWLFRLIWQKLHSWLCLQGLAAMLGENALCKHVNVAYFSQDKMFIFENCWKYFFLKFQILQIKLPTILSKKMEVKYIPKPPKDLSRKNRQCVKRTFKTHAISIICVCFSGFIIKMHQLDHFEDEKYSTLKDRFIVSNSNTCIHSAKHWCTEYKFSSFACGLI